MKAFAIRFLVGAALLLQLAPARVEDTVKLAYIDGLSRHLSWKSTVVGPGFSCRAADRAREGYSANRASEKYARDLGSEEQTGGLCAVNGEGI